MIFLRNPFVFFCQVEIHLQEKKIISLFISKDKNNIWKVPILS